MRRLRVGLAASELGLLVVLVALTTACGSGGFVAPEPWREVTAGRISGEHPVKHGLGVFHLDSDVRLAWVLSGPQNPRVTLSLRIESVDNGSGASNTIPPKETPSLPRRDDSGLGLTEIRPGNYRVYLVQRFPQGRGPGYDISFTLFTRPVPSPVPLVGS
jgi:hypothetical protein